MPLDAKGPRLWLRKARRQGARITHPPVWIIRDGRHSESTGCGRDDVAGAETKLAAYLNRKHIQQAAKGIRDPAQIPAADVISIYAAHVAPRTSRPKETIARLAALTQFFGDKLLADINGEMCREYARQRTTLAMARKELEDLRAAINHHRAEGHCDRIVTVVLPEKPEHREEWLTRQEAAQLLRSAWRYRETQKGHPTGRRSRRHVARFILVGLYTGTRAAAICSAAFDRLDGQGYVDLDRGVFYRRKRGRRRATKKRQTPVPLPRKLLAHMRRWKRMGQRFAVEWNGHPVGDVDKAFRRSVEDAGLRRSITPHVLRHTAATWLMQQGSDPWRAAEYLGMSLETLLRNYGHHHPDYLREARDALDRTPATTCHTLPATERERMRADVGKTGRNTQ